MNNPVIACQQLAKQYHDGHAVIEVLSDITFSVAPREMLAIVGNSGSGKSTLLHLLGGLDKPTRGTVFINQNNIHQLSERDRCHLRNESIGFVYQFHHLLREFTALENVSMPLLIRGVDPKMIKEKATDLLNQVGLSHRLKHRLSELSGGERQRVAIARALVANPICVLADEPTGNLDPHNANNILELFFNLQEKQGTSVIMVTHDFNIANKAKRVLQIVEGRLQE